MIWVPGNKTTECRKL